MGPTVFEMIAQFPSDFRRRYLTLHSNSTLEDLTLFFRGNPANKVQTAFNGARCAFEVKRSKDYEIEVYSSSYRDCASDSYYKVNPYLRVTITKDGSFSSYTHKSRPKPQYLDFSFDDIPKDHESSVTIRRSTMMQENAWLNSVDFCVLVFAAAGNQDVCAALWWGFKII
jgi:hypothetical protein